MQVEKQLIILHNREEDIAAGPLKYARMESVKVWVKYSIPFLDFLEVWPFLFLA